MIKKIIFLVYFISTAVVSIAQNAGIGTTTPNSSAALDITSSNKGLLPPRVALTGITDVTTIPSPAVGLLIYNTAAAGIAPNNVVPGFYYYTGTNWLRIGQSANAPGDIQYWNGKQWVVMPAGSSGKILTMCNGVPTWGPCIVPVLPTVTTGLISSITGTTAIAAGTVNTNGNGIITERGICYDFNPNPTVTRYSQPDATNGTGSFSVSLVDLWPSTTIYARAYATNAAGTAYGSQVTFVTTAVTAPVINTLPAFAVGSTTAFTTIDLLSDGGNPSVSRGIVYNTSPNPNISNDLILLPSTGLSFFTIPFLGLQLNTTYYAKAYSGSLPIGNTYGNEISFTTLDNDFFAAAYTFDSVKTNSGLLDPTPLQVLQAINRSDFSVMGAGAPTFNPTATSRFSFTGWTLGASNGSNVFTSATDSTSKYFEVTIAPDPGQTVNLNSLTFRWQRSAAGVRQAFVRSSADGFTNNLAAGISPSNANLSVVANNKFQITDATITAQDGCTIALGGAAFTGLATAVTFRIYGTNAETASGNFSIDNVVINGKVF